MLWWLGNGVDGLFQALIFWCGASALVFAFIRDRTHGKVAMLYGEDGVPTNVSVVSLWLLLVAFGLWAVLGRLYILLLYAA